MTGLLIVVALLAWGACGAIAYWLVTVVFDCRLNLDRVLRGVLTILGPVGLVVMLFVLFAICYFGALQWTTEVAVSKWERFVARVSGARGDDHPPRGSKGGSTPNQIYR